MKYVGVDLHKQIIVLCVVVVVDGQRQVACRRKLACRDVAGLAEFFGNLGSFQLCVEATAAYEWLLELVDPCADRIVLVHPRKMRIIAESRRKTDRLDAQILAEFWLPTNCRKPGGPRRECGSIEPWSGSSISNDGGPAA
jgi:hypothetical protein